MAMMQPPRQAAPATPPKEGNNHASICHCSASRAPTAPLKEGNNHQVAMVMNLIEAPATPPEAGNFYRRVVLFPSLGGVPVGWGGS